MENETEKQFYQYREWYNRMNKETGGLILQATAARLLNTPRQNINRMIKIGKLKTYQFSKEHEIYLGINEIEKIMQERIKRAKETNNTKFTHKGVMNIKQMVDVTDIPNNLPLEWAEEWIINQPEESFSDFINKKKKIWSNRNPNKKIPPPVEENGLEIRTAIALTENEEGKQEYTYINFQTPTTNNIKLGS
ncbi:hypothetical protein [uncultured Victivallis sp.]|jgi:hypothetical protein|uniref:hypothetical protein n=1 Tax=uncultured Victivallis sp. TaxID=354118 RepID=UPI0025EF9983|nr:hypothetical protein [uncultured Victivallis sp.]